jgi:polyadenylate-binding protein
MDLKKEPSKTLIYVSNLPFDTTDEQFRDLFKGFGLKTAYVAKRKNGRSKGFGFANLEKDSDQKAVIEKVNGAEFEKRKLIAKIAYNDDRRNEKGELREEFKTQINQTVVSETVVHVSNIEWTVNDEELKKIFEDLKPKVATVATRRNGKSKGFGFVELHTKEDQEKAIKLNGTTVGTRQITVQASTGYKKERGNNNNDNNNNRRPRRNNNDNNRRTGNNNRFNVVRKTERRSENTLYISNLPFELDDNDLKQIFQEFQPKSAHIPLRRNDKSRGYGFVEFSNSKDQSEALKALDQSEVNGRLVTIRVSTPNSNNNNRVTVRRNNDNRSNRSNYRNNNDDRRNNNNDDRRNNNDRRRNDNRNNDNRNNDNRYNNDNRNNRSRFSRNDNDNRSNRSNNNNYDRSNRPPRNENREKSNNMVYVSNLSFSVDDKALEGVFKGLKITKAYIATRKNGFSKGFGFVEFASAEDQQKAINLNGKEVEYIQIVVQAALKVDQKTK